MPKFSIGKKTINKYAHLMYRVIKTIRQICMEKSDETLWCNQIFVLIVNHTNVSYMWLNVEQNKLKSMLKDVFVNNTCLASGFEYTKKMHQTELNICIKTESISAKYSEFFCSRAAIMSL